MDHQPPSRDRRCSFCDRRPQAPHQLIAGPPPSIGMPAVAICRDCVALSTEIIAEQTPPTGDPPPAAA